MARSTPRSASTSRRRSSSAGTSQPRASRGRSAGSSARPPAASSSSTGRSCSGRSPQESTSRAPRERSRSSRGCPSRCAAHRMAKPFQHCPPPSAVRIPAPCPRPPTPSVQVPSLPRIRSRRGAPAGAPEVEARPRITELQGEGISWIHLLGPTTEEAQLLSSRFGWHPLDVEDVLSRRQRPKVDVYADDPEGGYLFAVLHFPVYDKTVGRLNAGELDVFLGPDYLVTLPNVELRPVTLLFRRAYESEEVRHQLLSRGTGRLFYEVLDDLYDYCFPILDKIGFKLEQIDEEIGAA